MEMTPEQMAFIKGQPANEPKAPVAKATFEKTIELPTPDQQGEVAKEPAGDPRTRASRRVARDRSSRSIPEASEILDQVLVPVTIRLQHRTAQALRRTSLEQQLKHAKPDTQQKIVEEALGDWLDKNGYLD